MEHGEDSAPNSSTASSHDAGGDDRSKEGPSVLMDSDNVTSPLSSPGPDSDNVTSPLSSPGPDQELESATKTSNGDVLTDDGCRPGEVNGATTTATASATPHDATVTAECVVEELLCLPTDVSTTDRDDDRDDNDELLMKETDDRDDNDEVMLMKETTATPSGSLREKTVDDGGMEGKEEERCLLLIKPEMDHCNVQQPESSSSGTGEEEEESRRLVEKAVQLPVRTCAVLCGAFFFVYTANLAIQNLQSSLHQAAGLGVTSLAVLYGSIIVFGTLSPLVIRFLTAKRTLVLAFVCHLLYTLSNFYPTFPTLLTSSLLLGAMAGPMWTAQGLFCTATGMAYAAIKQMEPHAALSLFNGVFFAFYEATQISGNLIASVVLMRGSYNETATSTRNKVCGAALCPGTSLNSTHIEQPEKHIVYILMSIYLACNVAGLLLTVFALPPLPRHQEIQAGESSLKKSTTSCLSMLLVPKMLLLLPFFMAQAMNSGILLAEYSEKFVSCSVGIQWVGYVMTAFGILTAAQAVGLNYAAKLLGRRVLFSAAATADMSVTVAMLLWDPAGTRVAYLFILPCFSGFAEGIFQAQFNSLVAMVFPDQMTGAFATYHTSKATAFTLTFVLARFLCLNQRLYVSLTLSAIGLLGYFVVECMLRRSKRREEGHDGQPKLVKITSQDKEQT